MDITDAKGYGVTDYSATLIMVTNGIDVSYFHVHQLGEVSQVPISIIDRYKLYILYKKHHYPPSLLPDSAAYDISNLVTTPTFKFLKSL